MRSGRGQRVCCPSSATPQPRRVTCLQREAAYTSVTMESGDHIHQNFIPSDLFFPQTKAAMTLKLDFKKFIQHTS